jgi:hypothetical protein
MPTAPVLDYFFTGAVLAFHGDTFAGFLSLSIPNEQSPFMNLRRASFLTAITLCVLAFFVSSSTASAVARVIGRLQVEPPALNVRVNGQPARPGSEIRQGDLVQTGRNSAVINLYSGQCVEVFANTLGRIYDSSGATSFVASRGGFRLLHPRGRRHDNDPLHFPGGGNLPGGGSQFPGGGAEIPGDGDGLESLPYLTGFIGNFAGAAIGGGGTGAQGPTTTRFFPGIGRVGLFDSAGTFIRFL